MIADEYKRKGYVVLRGAMNMKPISKDELYSSCRNIYAKSEDTYRSMCRTLAHQIGVMSMFFCPDICAAVDALGVHDKVFLTNPVAHFMAPDLWHEGVGAHQDWPALQSGLDTVVAWIPLFDVGIDDYPVEVVPGSHLLGLLPNKAGEHINEIDTAGMEFVPVTMKRGDVLLFSAFTVHRTRTPGTGFRAAFSHRYENAEDKSFIERGCYSAQRRVIDREVKWTPTVEQVRKVFL